AWRDAPRPQLAPEAKQTELSEQEKPALRQALASSAGFQGASVALDKSSGVATVRGEQTRYRDHREADERAAVLVANSLPEQQLRQLDIVYGA
ncbi:MAG: YjbH domain-containing protein, partial [Shewanella fodinae]|nr:YjbH domain-containing protein [Shewanella fodinae]